MPATNAQGDITAPGTGGLAKGYSGVAGNRQRQVGAAYSDEKTMAGDFSAKLQSDEGSNAFQQMKAGLAMNQSNMGRQAAAGGNNPLASRSATYAGGQAGAQMNQQMGAIRSQEQMSAMGMELGVAGRGTDAQLAMAGMSSAEAQANEANMLAKAQLEQQQLEHVNNYKLGAGQIAGNIISDPKTKVVASPGEIKDVAPQPQMQPVQNPADTGGDPVSWESSLAEASESQDYSQYATPVQTAGYQPMEDTTKDTNQGSGGLTGRFSSDPRTKTEIRVLKGRLAQYEPPEATDHVGDGMHEYDLGMMDARRAERVKGYAERAFYPKNHGQIDQYNESIGRAFRGDSKIAKSFTEEDWHPGQPIEIGEDAFHAVQDERDQQLAEDTKYADLNWNPESDSHGGFTPMSYEGMAVRGGDLAGAARSMGEGLPRTPEFSHSVGGMEFTSNVPAYNRVHEAQGGVAAAGQHAGRQAEMGDGDSGYSMSDHRSKEKIRVLSDENDYLREGLAGKMEESMADRGSRRRGEFADSLAGEGPKHVQEGDMGRLSREIMHAQREFEREMAHSDAYEARRGDSSKQRMRESMSGYSHSPQGASERRHRQGHGGVTTDVVASPGEIKDISAALDAEGRKTEAGFQHPSEHRRRREEQSKVPLREQAMANWRNTEWQDDPSYDITMEDDMATRKDKARRWNHKVTMQEQGGGINERLGRSPESDQLYKGTDTISYKYKPEYQKKFNLPGNQQMGTDATKLAENAGPLGEGVTVKGPEGLNMIDKDKGTGTALAGLAELGQENTGQEERIKQLEQQMTPYSINNEPKQGTPAVDHISQKLGSGANIHGDMASYDVNGPGDAQADQLSAKLGDGGQLPGKMAPYSVGSQQSMSAGPSRQQHDTYVQGQMADYEVDNKSMGQVKAKAKKRQDEQANMLAAKLKKGQTSDNMPRRN
jgi:hypothetical protein